MRIKLSVPLSVSEVVRFTNALNKGYCEDIKIAAITTDTRNIEKGDLFFALTGERYDGNDFCKEAEEAGALVLSSSYGGKCLLVKDTSLALLNLASGYKNLLPMLRLTIGITGSVGKSTTKELLGKILGANSSVHLTRGNENNTVGVPLTILSAKADTEILILEFGMNHQGEIKALSECAGVDIGIITNIGSAHIGNLGSREMIAKAKSEIVFGMRGGVILTEYGETLLSHLENKKEVSCENSNADYYLLPISESLSESSFDFISKQGILQGVTVPLAGRHILYSLALAISAAVEAGLNYEQIRRGIESITPESVRHKNIKIDDYIILDDSYNASPESIYAALRLLSMYKNHPKSALIGDIHELGAETKRIHEEVGEVAYRSGIENLYLFGVYSAFTAEGAIRAGMDGSKIHVNLDPTAPEVSADQINKHHNGGEVILFKASHKTNVGRIIELLKGDSQN